MASVECLSARVKLTATRSFNFKFCPDIGHFVFVSGGFTSDALAPGVYLNTSSNNILREIAGSEVMGIPWRRVCEEGDGE
jgi:hypothetical protein